MWIDRVAAVPALFIPIRRQTFNMHAEPTRPMCAIRRNNKTSCSTKSFDVTQRTFFKRYSIIIQIPPEAVQMRRYTTTYNDYVVIRNAATKRGGLVEGFSWYGLESYAFG